MVEDLQKQAADILNSVSRNYNLHRYYNKARGDTVYNIYIVTERNIEFVFEKILSSNNIKKCLMNKDVKHLGFISMNNINEYIENKELVSFIKDSTKRYIFYDAYNLFAFSIIIGEDDRMVYLHCYYVEELVYIHALLSRIEKYFSDHHKADIILKIARCTNPEDYPKPGVFLVNTLVFAYLLKAKEQFVFNIKENNLGMCEIYIENMIHHFMNFIRNNAFMNRLREKTNNAFDNNTLYTMLRERQLLKYGNNATIIKIEEKIKDILRELFEVIGAI